MPSSTKPLPNMAGLSSWISYSAVISTGLDTRQSKQSHLVNAFEAETKIFIEGALNSGTTSNYSIN